MAEPRDGALRLVLREHCAGDQASGRVPELRFDLLYWGERVGHLNLRTALTARLRKVGGHLGYGVDQAHRGRGLALRAARLVLPVAREHGLQRLLITVSEDNTPSRRTAERLGAQLAKTEPVATKEGTVRVCRYWLEL